VSIQIATIFAHAFVWAVIAAGIAWVLVTLIKEG
jgi:hypothetical protein